MDNRGTQDTERITNKTKTQIIQLKDEQRRAHQKNGSEPRYF